MSARPRTSRRTSSANGNGGGKWCWPVTRLAIYLRDSLTCMYCGKDLHGVEPHYITLDHVRCRRTGAKPNHKPSNLVCCCRKCNSAKQDETAEAFLASLYFDSEWLIRWRLDEIRKHTRRDMERYMALAKSLIEERSVARAQEVS